MVYRSVPYIRFAYPTAKVESIGNPFVTEKALNQLLEARSLNSFKNLANSYKDFSVDGEKAEEIQRSLDLNMINSVETLKEDSPKSLKEFYDRFVEFLDSYNLKNFLKAKIMGLELDVTPFSKDFRRVVDLIKTANGEEIPRILGEYGFNISADTDPIDVEIQVDRYVIERLREAKVPKIAREARDEFVGRLIDIANIRNLIRMKTSDASVERYEKLFLGEGREIAEWRFKDLFTAKNLDEIILGLEGTSYYDTIKQGYEESKRQGNTQILEISLDKMMLKSVGDISTRNFPFFGPLLKFIVSRHFEIRNLRVIVKGIEENLPKDRIKPLLVIGG